MSMNSHWTKLTTSDCHTCGQSFSRMNPYRKCCSRKCYIERWTKKTTDGCWLWTRKPATGNALADWDGEYQLAHRFSYETFKGPIPDGLVIMHSCDRGRCANPDHLDAGTQHTNIIDARDRGSIYKLTPEDARDIASSTQTTKALADHYKVHYSTIWNVRKGIRWGDVTGIKRDS